MSFAQIINDYLSLKIFNDEKFELIIKIDTFQVNNQQIIELLNTLSEHFPNGVIYNYLSIGGVIILKFNTTQSISDIVDQVIDIYENIFD